MKRFFPLVFLLFTGCDIPPLTYWQPIGDEYVNINATFLPHEYPEIEERVRQSLDLLETGINSENFRDFVMAGDINEDNQETYDRFMSSDFEPVIQITHAYPNIRGFHVNSENIIFVHDHFSLNQHNLYEFTAIMAHEYGHTIGFDHPRNSPWMTSFSVYLQLKGERFFKDVYQAVSNNSYPKKGHWLVF